MNFKFFLAQFLASQTCEESCPYINAPLDDWSFIEKKYWIASKDPGIRPKGSQNCPGEDMVEVQGKMKINPGHNPYAFNTVENLQKSTCTKWIEKKFPERCASFDQQKWEKIRAELPEKDMHFCIDPYEWPNKQGASPWIMVTWDESQKLCESKGKRLCSEDEWTFACEGEEALPFPNGYIRDSQKCNIDKPWYTYDTTLMFPRGTKDSGKELNKLWQGHVSGSDPQCVSPFGVHDMVGNIDEWTVASRPNKYPSILKGGYWGPVRTRCRPSTRNHGPGHIFYQQGFRCCSNPLSTKEILSYRD
jgi:hypothetical protein